MKIENISVKVIFSKFLVTKSFLFQSFQNISAEKFWTRAQIRSKFW